MMSHSMRTAQVEAPGPVVSARIGLHRFRRLWAACAAGAFVLCAGQAGAVQSIAIPNASFEGPPTFFAYPDAETWDESGPIGEDPQLPGVEDTLDTGVFFNSPFLEGGVPSPYYIPNGDGAQIGFISANDAADIAFYQELDTPYEPGASYTVNLLVGESSFLHVLTYNPNDPDPPPNPDPALLVVSLYYVDSSGVKVTLTDRVVSAAELPAPPQQGLLLVDVGTTGAEVAAGDAWMGAPIGVMIRPLLGLAGVWNVDHARVTAACALGTAGDTDLDGDVDFTDHARAVACLSGPGATARAAGCPPCAFERLDVDADGDVDLHDYVAFARQLGG